MKNLKKTLSLVLVAVMMLGILTIGAGAAFTDQDDVDYTEAVEVLSAIKVLEGFEDGSFKPDQILTREQAAKIVAYAMIGKTAADALTTGEAPFSDVAATRWSAGYITFCVNQGILNGYGDGRFGPADTLTGFQFAKMLLTALGYGRNDEFVGSNWTIEVAKLAIPLGIFDGNTDGASNAPCTREAAALYAFNAMTKCMTVNYSEILGTYYSGTSAFGSPDFDFEYTLADQVYGLSQETAVSGGRLGYYWVANADRITGFYSADTVLAVSGDGTPIAKLLDKTSSSFKAAPDNEIRVYYNGEPLHNSDAYNVSANALYFDVVEKILKIDDGDGIANAADEDYAIKRGTSVELIDTALDVGSKVDVINIIEKEVITIVEIQDFAGYIKLVTDNAEYDRTGYSYYEAGLDIEGYEDLKAGDKALAVVLDGVLQLTKCETITGKLESEGVSFYVQYYQINGQNYYKSGLDGANATINNYDAELTYFLDDFGNIVATSKDITAAQYTYGLVLAAGSGLFNPIQCTGAYAKIQIFNQNGETVIYDIVTATGKVDTVTANLYADKVGKLVRFKLNTSGKINSIEVAETKLTDVTYTKGAPMLDTYYVNSSTYFFYFNAETNNYAVIKGYTNASSLTTPASGNVFYTGSVANAVVLHADIGGAGEYIYLASTDYSTGRLKDGTVYYTYKVFKDGAQIDMNFAVQDAFNGIFGGAVAGAYKVEKDSVTELYSWGSWLTDMSAEPVVYADETYFVDTAGSTYLISNTTKVFKINATALDIVLAVDAAVMVGPTTDYDVLVTDYDVTATATDGVYTVNAVYYKLVPKA
jgi:hypothetical protein